MMPPEISRDNEVFDAIRASIATRGRMPTTKELCFDIKIQRGQLYRNVERLVERGQLRRLPVGTLRLESGCMWPQALEVMRAWGFVFKSEMIWRKTTRNGKVRMGTGYRMRTMHEPILVGTIGNPDHAPFPSIFDGLAREHSRKPESFYSLIDRYAPRLKGRADLFARQQRSGWDAFGNETEKFEVAA